MASPVKLSWDPSSAVKSSVKEYSRSLQNSPNKTSSSSNSTTNGAASPARSGLMSPSRDVGRSLLHQLGSPKPPSVSATPPSLMVPPPTESAAGVMMDDDPPETEVVLKTADGAADNEEEVTTVGNDIINAGDDSSDSSVEITLDSGVQEIIESGRTDDEAVLAALDAVLENIQTSNPGSPVRTAGKSFFASDLPVSVTKSPVRTATVTSYAHTAEGDLVYAPRSTLPEVKSAATSPMVLPTTKAAGVDASTSPASTTPLPSKRSVSTYTTPFTPAAPPLSPILEVDPYADGQTSFTTTPSNNAYIHPFSFSSSAAKSPLIDQFASVSASAALQLPSDSASSVDGRSGLTSEVESVQSEEPAAPYHTLPTAAAAPSSTHSSPDRGARFLRSTPHKRRPLSEGGFGGRGYRSAAEERKNSVMPAISLSLFYTYFLVVLMVFASLVSHSVSLLCGLVIFS